MSTISKPGVQLAEPKQPTLPDGAVPKVFTREGLQPGAEGICFCDRHQFDISYTLSHERVGLALLLPGHRGYELGEKGISKEQAAK
eukprot:8524427-Karenia_brevis.AAC.1